MICVDIQDNADLRKEMEEAVGIFTGFCNEYLRSADTDVAADGLEDTADRDRRVLLSCQQDM